MKSIFDIKLMKIGVNGTIVVKDLETKELITLYPFSTYQFKESDIKERKSFKVEGKITAKGQWKDRLKIDYVAHEI